MNDTETVDGFRVELAQVIRGGRVIQWCRVPKGEFASITAAAAFIASRSKPHHYRAIPAKISRVVGS